MPYVYSEIVSHADTKSAADFIKQDDVNVVRTELGRRIVAVTAVMNNTDSILINGKQRDVKVIGSDQYYKNVRNLVVPAGRFLDASDIEQRARVCLLPEKLAYNFYGTPPAPPRQTLNTYPYRSTLLAT